MFACKKLYFVIYLTICYSIAFSQKYFEGTYTQEVDFGINGTDKSTMIMYHKGNKNRTDYNKLTDANPFKSIAVVDFIKQERFMLMEMPKLKSKSATISDLTSIDSPIETIEKFDDYKMILNHKCQKVILRSVQNGKETKLIGYADLDYIVKTLIDFSGKTIDYPLFFESEVDIPNVGLMTTKIVSISEEVLSEDLFNTNIPRGYQIIDLRKIKKQTTISDNNLLNNPPSQNFNQQPTTTNNYTNYSVIELNTKLEEALKIEDFDTATLLKKEIDNRNLSIKDKYSLKTITELQDQLDAAVKIEDFDTATEIQSEIKRRGN